MTTITLPRAVVEQALEALEGWDNYGKWVWPESALEHAKRNTTEAITALRAALAQQAEAVEPAAWMYTGIKQDGTEHGPHLVWKPEYMDAMSASKGAKAKPLYTAPSQRKPLSEDEIDAIPCTDGDGSDWDALVRFARAIERAHGIGEGA